QDDRTTAPLAPVLYDINKNEYITRFTPVETPVDVAPVTNPVASPETSSSKQPQNMGAILGGVIGSLSIIALSVGVFIFLRRRDSRSDNDCGPENDSVYRKVAMESHEQRHSQDATSVASRLFGKQTPSATSLTLTSIPVASGPQLYVATSGQARSPHGDPVHSLAADGHGKGAEEVRGPQAVI
ncbi:hypothetical protein BGZ70_009627, partial [Mortierella alpina]